jgi:hypothetical protein
VAEQNRAAEYGATVDEPPDSSSLVREELTSLPPKVVVVTRQRREPRSGRSWLPVVGGVFGLLAVLTIVGVTLLGRELYSLMQESDQPNRVVQSYFEAIRAGDWTTAQSHLSADLRASTGPSALRDTWQQRTRANGPVTGFAITNTNVGSYSGQRSARVVGAIGYGNAAPESRTLTLIKEGADWKLSALP